MTTGGAVLIGSGPSLNEGELCHLAPRFSISFNRSYIAWEDWGYVPSYYACTMAATAELLMDEIDDVLRFQALQRIWLHSAFRRKKEARADPRVVFVEPEGQTFGVRGETIGDYGNAGATALQLLAHAGHTRILLMGTDARYAPPTGEGKLRDSYFRPDYSPAQLAPASAQTEGWVQAIAHAQAHGMSLRLRSGESAIHAMSGLPLDTAPLETVRTWLEAA